ncbi:hypothetical protein Anapl_00069 [Anas platyrhynchos]|uniref:Uncharacterized protein n=1 Tax=Anas platyrhynchos TaxID=8839 RepID=R0LQ10_ANAPL|nr:hypothetical protein Anapl_00069 [Anas platyrhynchos]
MAVWEAEVLNLPDFSASASCVLSVLDKFDRLALQEEPWNQQNRNSPIICLLEGKLQFSCVNAEPSSSGDCEPSVLVEEKYHHRSATAREINESRCEHPKRSGDAGGCVAGRKIWSCAPQQFSLAKVSVLWLCHQLLSWHQAACLESLLCILQASCITRREYEAHTDGFCVVLPLCCAAIAALSLSLEPHANTRGMQGIAPLSPSAAAALSCHTANIWCHTFKGKAHEGGVWSPIPSCMALQPAVSIKELASRRAVVSGAGAVPFGGAVVSGAGVVPFGAKGPSKCSEEPGGEGSAAKFSGKRSDTQGAAAGVMQGKQIAVKITHKQKPASENKAKVSKCALAPYVHL